MVVACALNFSSWRGGDKGGYVCDFKVSLACRVSSRIPRATWRKPILGGKKKKTENKTQKNTNRHILKITNSNFPTFKML